MRNWNINTSQFDENSEEYKVWKLEQLINFGLNGEKINEDDLKSRLHALHIDSSKRRFLEFILGNAQTN